MICPKCRNNVTGKWCTFCGENLEAAYGETAPAPENTDMPYTDNFTPQTDYRDAQFNDEPVEGYIPPEEIVNPYNNYYGQPPEEGNKSKVVAIVSVIVAVTIAIGVLLYAFVFSKDNNTKDDTGSSQSENGQISDKSNSKDNTEEDDDSAKVKELTKDGEKYMREGKYEDAEKVYSELEELTEDEEVGIICDILYNYNKAIEKLDSGDYDRAEDYYDDIPDEYINYDIKSDVKDLKDNIKTAKNARNAVDEIKEYIDDEDLESARDAVDSIDSSNFPTAEKEELEELISELEELEQEAEEKEKEKSRSYEYPDSGYGRLGFSDAEDIIENYCINMVDAINENDFDYVSPYILSTSDFYEEQKNLVKSCNDQGIYEYFEWVELDKLTEISKTKWEAKVTEAETIYKYDDNYDYTEEYKTFEWTYTIEYKDHYFYISGIK